MEKDDKVTKRISWTEYFLVQAKIIALRSSCPRLTVGCVIVRNKRTIAGGYNGSIRGDVHCIDEGCKIRDNHCIRSIHAEANAILQCAKLGVPTDGAHLYATHFPCLNCAKLIIQAGITRVYYGEDYCKDEYALELFRKAAVTVTKISSSFEVEIKNKG
jgi:dCMP deaminase